LLERWSHLVIALRRQLSAFGDVWAVVVAGKRAAAETPARNRTRVRKARMVHFLRERVVAHPGS